MPFGLFYGYIKAYMQQNPFWNLMAKKLSGEISPEELLDLEALLKQTPELGYAAEHIENLWKLHPTYNAKETEQAFEKHIAMLEAKGIHLLPDAVAANNDTYTDNEPKKRNRKLILFAILIALAGCTAFIFWSGRKTSPSNVPLQMAEIYTSPGTRKKIVLPDSSVVWLNAGSKLSYAQSFGDKERVVTLTGEAFFDVVKSTTPFIIHTSDIQIKVLGTAFNVRSYPDEKKVETSLVRGRVEITLDKSPEKKYVLNPNEKLTLNKTDDTEKPGPKKQQLPLAIESTLRYYDSSTIVETSWVNNKLVFSDESFEEVAKKMERWYEVHIVFNSDKLKAERLTGIFEKETVRQALEALQITVPFHFTIKDKEIIITH